MYLNLLLIIQVKPLAQFLLALGIIEFLALTSACYLFWNKKGTDNAGEEEAEEDYGTFGGKGV